MPNPRHAQLVALLKAVHARSDEVGRAYQRVYAAMRSGKVWTGPAATKWTDEIGDHHHRLGRLVRQITRSIEGELRRHPPLVTRAQAELLRRQTSGR